MLIRLGYVALSKTIDITSSKTITYTNYLKEKNLDKIDEIIIENLNNLKELLIYNGKNDVHFFRITSKLIPLASKNDVVFDYINKYKEHYEEIKTIINKYQIRVDFHPDQFAVLNSTNKDVVENTIEILKYHYKILKILDIKNKIIILHIGSNVFGKEKSITRFINNFNKLPKYLQKSIAIENDDKIFNIEDTLYICEKLNIPCVLDYHHHICNHNNIELDFKRIFKTWKNMTPKIHFSSPKNLTKKDFRSHNDYINSEDFIKFIDNVKNLETNLDIMLEAKAKDEALFRLVRELKYKTNYYFIDNTSFII